MKRTNKILITLLVLVLAVALLPMVFAAGADYEVRTGETISVPMDLGEVYGFELHWEDVTSSNPGMITSISGDASQMTLMGAVRDNGAFYFYPTSTLQKSVFTLNLGVSGSVGSTCTVTVTYKVVQPDELYSETMTKTFTVKIVAETAPTEPSTQPSSQPTQPSSQPTQPSSQPTQPSSQPTQPSSQPTQPSSQPTQPSSQPTQPSSQPTQPSSQPTTAPSEPTTAPSEPTTVPSEPTTAPSEPTTVPTEPGTDPTDPSEPGDGTDGTWTFPWWILVLIALILIAIIYYIYKKRKAA